MSVSRTQAKGLLLAVVCAAALAGAGMSEAATPKKPPLAAPVNCGKLISASLAEGLTRLGITTVTASTKKVKDGWVSSCRYHAATDDGSSPAISLVIYPMTAAKRTAFMKGLVSRRRAREERGPRAAVPAGLHRSGGHATDHPERLRCPASLRAGVVRVRELWSRLRDGEVLRRRPVDPR